MLSPYTVTIYTKQDNPYNVIPDAPIEIRERLANGTSGSLSTIYEDQEGLTPITQVGAKADSNGQFTFYAEAAQYNAVYESKTVPLDIGLTSEVADSKINEKTLTSDSNTEKQEYISCIPRVNAGVLSFVNDVDHQTLGFSSITNTGDFIMRINYAKTYEKVNHLSITIDDELCKYGVFTGGSVGVDHTSFTAYTQLRGQVDTTTMVFDSTGILPDSNAVTVSYVDDVLIIEHDNAAFNNDSVVVSQVYGLSFMTKFGVSQSASQINIIPWTEFAGSIIYDGTNFVNDPAKPWLISPTQTGIVMAWDGTVNALKIDHPLAGDYVVNVNAEFGGYTEYNVEVLSSSSFRVYFFNSSGTQVTTPNTSMKIMVSRPSCQLRGKIPTGAKFNIRAGIVPIRWTNLSSASGNNFWVNGVMQTPL